MKSAKDLKKNYFGKMFVRICMLLFFLLLLPPMHLISKNVSVDSLLSVLKTAKEDTNKVNTLNDLGWELRMNYPDSAIIYGKKAESLAQELHFQSGLALSCQHLSVFNRMSGNFALALEYGFKSMKMYEELKNEGGVAASCGNLGIVYSNLSDYPNSLFYYFKSLRLKEKNGLKEEISSTLVNIGVTYRNIGDLKKALDYYSQALASDLKINNKKRIAVEYGNIGNVYFLMNKYEEALTFAFKSLKMYEEVENKKGYSQQLANIGEFYGARGDSAKVHLDYASMNINYSTSFEYSTKALKLAQQIGDKKGAAADVGNIGGLYYAMKKYDKAEIFFLRALEMADSIGTQSYSMQDALSLSDLYTDMHKDESALRYYKRYIVERDKISNDENTQKQTRLEMNYDFDKKQTADSIKNEELVKVEEIKHNQEIQQQKIYTYGGATGFLLMLIVAGVSFRAFRNKQKANEIIFHQKLLVEEKQKEIIDSIHYAKRIQKSLLPTEKYIEKNINRLKNK